MCILHGLLSSITSYLCVHKTVFPECFITEVATSQALFTFLEQDGEEIYYINCVGGVINSNYIKVGQKVSVFRDFKPLRIKTEVYHIFGQQRHF